MLLRNKTTVKKITTPDSLSSLSDNDKDDSYEPTQEDSPTLKRRIENRSSTSTQPESSSTPQKRPKLEEENPTRVVEPIESTLGMGTGAYRSAELSHSPSVPFEFPNTPNLSRLAENLGKVYREIRIEGARDIALQTESQKIISSSVLNLPTHAHRAALCITMNRYSAFCAAIDFPAFPITAKKVSLFLTRSTSTPIGQALLLIIPQPANFPLPIVVEETLFGRGNIGQSLLGIEEGRFVTRELATSWTEGLAYAQGATRAVWENLLMGGVKELSRDPIILEMLSCFEPEAEMNMVGRERDGRAGSASMVRSRGMNVPPPPTSSTNYGASLGLMDTSPPLNYLASPPSSQYLHARSNSRSQSLGNPPNFSHSSLAYSHSRHSIAPTSQGFTSSSGNGNQNYSELDLEHSFGGGDDLGISASLYGQENPPSASARSLSQNQNHQNQFPIQPIPIRALPTGPTKVNEEEEGDATFQIAETLAGIRSQEEELYSPRSRSQTANFRAEPIPLQTHYSGHTGPGAEEYFQSFPTSNSHFLADYHITNQSSFPLPVPHSSTFYSQTSQPRIETFSENLLDRNNFFPSPAPSHSAINSRGAPSGSRYSHMPLITTNQVQHEINEWNQEQFKFNYPTSTSLPPPPPPSHSHATSSLAGYRGNNNTTQEALYAENEKFSAGLGIDFGNHLAPTVRGEGNGNEEKRE